MRPFRMLNVILALFPFAATAQMQFALYADRFDDRPKCRRGVQSVWFLNQRPSRRAQLVGEQLHVLGLLRGEEAELRLTKLPQHESVLVSFVLLLPKCPQCGPQRLQFSYRDGQQWIAPDQSEQLAINDATSKVNLNTAFDQDAWIIERVIPHDESALRLRWSIPDIGEGEFWAITDLDVRAVAEVKSLDISRIRTRSGLRSAVVFCGTDGLPSHGFLLFEREEARSHQTRGAAFGFYPDPDSGVARLISFRSVPGLLLNEFQTGQLSRVKEKLVVYVDTGQFRAAEGVISRWRCQPKYRLLSQDCVDLTREVALELGLEVPRRSLLRTRPADYIRELIEAN